MSSEMRVTDEQVWAAVCAWRDVYDAEYIHSGSTMGNDEQAMRAALEAALLARTEAGAVNEGVHVDSDCSLGLDPNRKTEAGYAAPWADGAVAQVLQVYKAEDEEEEAWFGHVEFTEPLKIGDLLYTHPQDASAGDACFVALQEILAAHANDNVRPRAFYIAADALAALQQKGSGNG